MYEIEFIKLENEIGGNLRNYLEQKKIFFCIAATEREMLELFLIIFAKRN